MPILAGFMVPHPPLIVPAVGRGGEEEIEETTRAYERVADEIAALKPETIIITSPHSIMYADYFHISPRDSARGSFANFGASEVSFREEYDTELVEAICDLAYEKDFPAGTMGERDRSLDHGTMVPLYFIEQKYRTFKLVRIGLSGLPLTDHYKLGQMISRAVDQTGRRVVMVASGDLSHKLQDYGPYGYAPEGPEYDSRIMDVMERGAFGELLEFDEGFCDRAAECGHRSFVIMAGAMDGRAVKAQTYSHQDVTGVGYGIGSFYPGEPDEGRKFLEEFFKKEEEKASTLREGEDEYVSLARRSLETYIRTGRKIEVPEGLPEELTSTQAGAFVSIHKQGRLRGCIGTIEGVQDNLAEEIINNAISASTADPRFPAITEDELKWLEINVDVLGEAEPIYSMDQLDPKRYGVIVTKGYRRGLLLPDLDGVDTAEQQVEIAKNKAGIRPGEDVRLQRFEVIRHK
ncbi:MAG: AmmeMemoRadiSam system protein A [Lachnospiraceae bacterium]|nr:AmmeMemoRadiSam system protein A [Lachnospiraceae bacterium]